MNKLVNGKVPVGETCPYNEYCLDVFKNKLAFNGKGCAISNGKTASFKVSCGLCRLFDILDENELKTIKEETKNV